MTAKELDEAIAQFGLTIEQAAHHLGVGVRSMHYYLAGQRPVPKPVAIAIRQQQELRRIRTVISTGTGLIW